MSGKLFFTELKRGEFLSRIRGFLDAPDKCAPAVATLKVPGSMNSIVMDGDFNYEEMVFAAKDPEDCVQLIRAATSPGYEGARLIVEYNEPATLSMNFAVTCALAPRPSEKKYKSWLVLELLPKK